MKSIRYASYSLIIALLFHILLLLMLFITLYTQRDFLSNHVRQAKVLFDHKRPQLPSQQIAPSSLQNMQQIISNTTSNATQKDATESSTPPLELPLDQAVQPQVNSSAKTITNTSQSSNNAYQIPSDTVEPTQNDITPQKHESTGMRSVYELPARHNLTPVQPKENRTRSSVANKIAALRKAGIFNQIRNIAQQDFAQQELAEPQVEKAHHNGIPTEKQQSAIIAGSRAQGIPNKYRHVQERISFWSDAHYQQKVCNAILNAARIYPKYLDSPQDVETEIMVNLPIYPDGSLGDIDPSELTGVAAIDNALLGILKLTNFPPLPAHIKKKVKVYYKAIRIRVKMQAGSNYFQVTAI